MRIPRGVVAVSKEVQLGVGSRLDDGLERGGGGEERKESKQLQTVSLDS